MSVEAEQIEQQFPSTDADLDREAQDAVMDVDATKIQILPGASEDLSSATFQILEEDHTLGNALRYMIMKNPEVEFCGYSIPHPSEAKMNIRIQTYGTNGYTAVDAIEKALDDLVGLCDHVDQEFEAKYAAFEEGRQDGDVSMSG
ncbi:RNA polymerase subunit AC19 [Saitoella coloradoensis]